MLGQLLGAARKSWARTSRSSPSAPPDLAGLTDRPWDAGIPQGFGDDDAFANMLNQPLGFDAEYEAGLSPCDTYCGLCGQCTKVLTRQFASEPALLQNDVMQADPMCVQRAPDISDKPIRPWLESTDNRVENVAK